jgi:hypothetical protein
VIVFNINDIKNKLIMDDKLIIFEVKRMLGELISTKCSVLSESQKETIIDNTMNSFDAFVCKAMYDGFTEASNL